MCGLNVMQTITPKVNTIQSKEGNMLVVKIPHKNPTKNLLRNAANQENPTYLKDMEQI